MLRRSHKLILAATATIALASCASSIQPMMAAGQNATVVQTDQLPVPANADYGADERPFIIGPYDILDIVVYGVDDLALEDVQVDASGRITFPLIGTVEVAGKTPGEVASAIQYKLQGRFVRNAQVTVNLKDTASQVVAISGEIKKPGVYPIVGQMTLLKTIARAEGWTEFSKKREVLIFRRVGGKQYVALYDVKAIESGRYGDPTIYANDTVVVGDSQARRNLKDIFAVVPPLLGPIIFLLGQ